VAGTWFASDLGPGGHAGGNLLSGGAATGSGELAFPTPNGQFTVARASRWLVKRSPRASHAFLNENQATTCSRRRAQPRLASKGCLMLDSTQSSDGVITKPSSTSVAQTIDGLRRLIADRGFTVFNVIDHRGVAERAGVQMPDSKLVMLGKRAVGAAVMVAAPLAALDIPLKVLVWEDRNGAVSVSYNSPGFLAGRHHLKGALRAPFDAVESIVEALPGD
jgi:uncharacterized protein (DUF302 family)